MAEGIMTVGNVRIAGLTDAEVDSPAPLDRLFPGVPLDAWAPYRERYPEAFGSPTTWHNHFGCYLIRSQGRTILVDAGIGPADAPLARFLNRAGRLLEELRAEGVGPDDIDTVVLTHLHADHVGWNVRESEGTYRLTFPHARYIIHETDWKGFHQPNLEGYHERGPGYPTRETFIARCVTPIEALGALQLIDGEYALTSEITIIPTPGHTPGHVSLFVASGGERAVILGDILLHPAQVSEPDWTAMYDMDGEKARATRRRLLDRIEAEGLKVAVCHFPGPGFGQVVRLEGRRYWQAL
jgi:glyoxylase-like metal-dependent hydrolase (beta-lactamase superfamily II)